MVFLLGRVDVGRRAQDSGVRDWGSREAGK